MPLFYLVLFASVTELPYREHGALIVMGGLAGGAHFFEHDKCCGMFNKVVFKAQVEHSNSLPER